MVNNDLTIIYVPKFVKHFFRVLLIEMKVNEGKVVFNYLKSINKDERDAYIQYDQMDAQQRKFILKNIIISYLVDCYYYNTLLFDGVNWSPDKRRYRIIDYVIYKYHKMDSEERELIIEKILNN